MESPIISDVRTVAYKEGIAEGMKIAREMLCKSIGKDYDSFGSALARVDMIIMEMDRMKREKTTIDE
jgi:hypothetical protein